MYTEAARTMRIHMFMYEGRGQKENTLCVQILLTGVVLGVLNQKEATRKTETN